MYTKEIDCVNDKCEQINKRGRGIRGDERDSIA